MNVVITGGLGALGMGCAHAFLKTGAKVVLADIQNDTKILTLLGQQYEEQLQFFVCDVTQPRDCATLVTQSEDFFNSSINVYMANAGVPYSGEFLLTGQEQIRHVIDVNILGSIFSAQAAIPSLLKSPSSLLLFTCSLQSTLARAHRSIYTASKHAIAGLVKSLSLEFARQGLRVNGIAPAAIETPFFYSTFEYAKVSKSEGLQVASESLPLGRLPTVEEFAETAVFLATSAAASITGQMIMLDAGASAGIFSKQPLGSINSE